MQITLIQNVNVYLLKQEAHRLTFKNEKSQLQFNHLVILWVALLQVDFFFYSFC